MALEFIRISFEFFKNSNAVCVTFSSWNLSEKQLAAEFFSAVMRDYYGAIHSGRP